MQQDLIVWRHENVSLCAGSSINANYQLIASCTRCQLQTLDPWLDLGKWLIAVRQKAIIWANFDYLQVLWCHMASLEISAISHFSMDQMAIKLQKMKLDNFLKKKLDLPTVYNGFLDKGGPWLGHSIPDSISEVDGLAPHHTIFFIA